MSTRVGEHPDDVVARVAAHAAAGLTTREIGRQVGMTRYQVLGICYRRGIRLHHRPKGQCGAAAQSPRTPVPLREMRLAPPPRLQLSGSEIPLPSLAQLMGRR